LRVCVFFLAGSATPTGDQHRLGAATEGSGICLHPLRRHVLAMAAWNLMLDMPLAKSFSCMQ
jgi:hypothetical protein